MPTLLPQSSSLYGRLMALWLSLASHDKAIDNLFTGGSAGGDGIFGDGGADVITLPNHLSPDTVVFGQDAMGDKNDVLAITDGNDAAYLGHNSFQGTGYSQLIEKRSL
jgi:hypothetical protein